MSFDEHYMKKFHRWPSCWTQLALAHGSLLLYAWLGFGIISNVLQFKNMMRSIVQWMACNGSPIGCSIVVSMHIIVIWKMQTANIWHCYGGKNLLYNYKIYHIRYTKKKHIRQRILIQCFFFIFLYSKHVAAIDFQSNLRNKAWSFILEINEVPLFT